jgi:hypothetical protein
MGSAGSKIELGESFRNQYYVAYTYRLQRDLPPQVPLSDPVVLYKAFDGMFLFQLDWISSAEVTSATRASCLHLLGVEAGRQ